MRWVYSEERSLAHASANSSSYLICKLLQHVLDGDRFENVPLLIENLRQTAIGRIKIEQYGGASGHHAPMYIALWHVWVTAGLSGDLWDFNAVLKGYDLERALQYGGSHFAEVTMEMTVLTWLPSID